LRHAALFEFLETVRETVGGLPGDNFAVVLKGGLGRTGREKRQRPPALGQILQRDRVFGRVEVGVEIIDAELVEVFLDNALFPGFFGWIVPAAGGARIGFGTTMHANARAAEKKFFAGKAARAAVGKKAPSREYWAVIPAALRGKTQMGNALLVGDAAGQVKASTGGGVVFGGMCAKIAAESIYESISRGAPLGYEAAWKKKYGKTLAAHSFARNFLGALPNPLLDFFVASMNLGPRKLLERFGDMDFVLK
jgi:flavin-dependent dehydrogenase